MTPKDFAQHLTRFFSDYLPVQRNLSPNTIASYRDAFTQLLRYCQERHGIAPERLRLDRLDVAMLLGFLKHIQEDRHCKLRTRNQRLAALHAFFRYLQGQAPERLMQCQQILAIPRQRQEQTPVPYLPAEDLTALLAQPDCTTPAGRRHAVLLSLLYDTGARVQEVADLRVSDVRLKSPAQIQLTGKGRKARVVPLMARTVALLDAYVREHDLQREERLSGPLFFNHHGQHLSRSGIRYMVTKYSQSTRQMRPALPQRVTPHTLRHSKAMHLLQSDNPLTTIQAILGHADVKTCAIYATADLAMKRQALEKVAPLVSTPALPSWRSDQKLMDWLRAL